jgi:hypothetical protein
MRPNLRKKKLEREDKNCWRQRGKKGLRNVRRSLKRRGNDVEKSNRSSKKRREPAMKNEEGNWLRRELKKKKRRP